MTLNICHIVGYKNSGKTTLTGRLIKELGRYGKIVYSIKHHAHEETDPLRHGDSGHHYEQGAVVSSVVSPTYSHLSYHHEPPLEAFLAFYKTLDEGDWVLVEGYKNSRHPKLLLVRDLNDWKALSSLATILAVVSDDQSVHASLKNRIPLFHREDVEKLAQFLLALEGKEGAHEFV